MVCHCRVFIETDFFFFNQNLEMKLTTTTTTKTCVNLWNLLISLNYYSHCRDCNDFAQSIRLSYQRFEMSGNFTLYCVNPHIKFFSDFC